jgi:hypothetical protein
VLVSFTLRVIGKRRLFLSVPFLVAEIQAWPIRVSAKPAATTGQLDLLKMDSVANGAMPGLRVYDLYRPVAVRSIVSSRPSAVYRQ